MTSNTQPRTSRQGRLHRRKVADPFSLEQTERWMSALEMLTVFPALTSQQMARLLFLNLPNTKGEMRVTEGSAQKAANHKWLSRLKNLGLVEVKGLPQPGKMLARWELNYLTKKGYDQLVEVRQSLNQAPPLPRRNPAKLTHTEVDHHFMAVMDAGVAIVAAAIRREATVERVWDDMTIRALKQAGKLHWPMEPDLLVILRYNDNRQAFFIEVDRGTESVASPSKNSWKSKMGKYKLFFSAQRQTDPWLKDLPQPQVLTISYNPRRLPNLQETTGNVGGRSSYWFTHAEYTQPPYSFFDRIWERIGLDGYYSILERFPS